MNQPPGADGGTGDADLAALRGRERKWLEAQRMARLGTWVWDLTSGGIEWSDELYRVFKLRKEEFVPTHAAWMARVDPADSARVEAFVQAALTDGRTWVIDYRVVAGDGSHPWVRSRGVVDPDATGGHVEMHGTTQDITDDMPADEDAPVPGTGHRILYDQLTGLASWHLFADRASAALARAAREETHTALLVIDIDQFHRINDELGHEGGDQVLVDVGQRLDAIFRPYDTVVHRPDRVARVGGDEFLVLCENVPDQAAARELCGRVARLLDAVVVDGSQIALTAGIGVALADPGDAEIEELIAHAESAMRSGKQRGPGAHTVFAVDMAEPDSGRAQAAQALERGFNRGELSLHYQPKLALDSDRIVGVEALLRWEDPERGMVYPAEFVPLAEETGLILPIGAWVIEQACRDVARWRTVFPDRPTLVVSVNVSPRQFGAELVETVAAMLRATGTEPGALCLEVTESLLMNDIDGSVQVVQELAELGVPVSIDDFGTGYSSLSYLKQLPLHELKIDKSFVEGLGRDANDTAIVAAVVAMAHALDLSVVAEGVETAEQLQWLRTLGCEQAQGYYFARPGPASQVDALLTAQADAPWLGHTPDLPSSAATDLHRFARVLIIDDSASVRQFAAVSLAAVGFEVHEAPDAETGLATAAEVVPDCVLLDVNLPDMSGLEACRLLRSAPETAGCTILMLTGNDAAADKVEAFSVGADDYVLKPFSPRELASRVNAAMRRRRAALEGTDPSTGPSAT